MKKILILALTALLALSALTACSADTADGGSDKLRIVTTIFPEYDWVMNILGDRAADAEVTFLLSSGVDMHSFQPSAADILKISSCDMLVYVGGESDGWVADALKEAVNKDMVTVNLLDSLGEGVREEEHIEGMQGEDDHGHEEEAEYDEHVWLSLKKASVLVSAIADALAGIDPDHAAEYRTNAEKYAVKLSALDADYQAAVEAASFDTLLFADRFPFRYMTEDYGLKYYAAFAGCSAETEADFETITFLSSKLDELGLPCVLTIEGSDRRMAETIVRSTISQDQEILTLDSMQATTGSDASDGISYLSVMEKNLEVLKIALQ